jgi:histone-lysine N-methyltransferase SETMAR
MYADLLKNHLRPAIKSKRRRLLNTGVLLQHDNARPHTSRSTVATIPDLPFERLPNLPYSPDLGPSDFHVFGPLKEAMGGKSFRSDEEVQQAVHE